MVPKTTLRAEVDVVVLGMVADNGWSVFLKGNWDAATFVTSYLPVLMIFVVYFGHSFYTKSSIVKPLDIDFFSGAPPEDEEEDNLYKGTVQSIVANTRRFLSRLAPH